VWIINQTIFRQSLSSRSARHNRAMSNDYIVTLLTTTLDPCVFSVVLTLTLVSTTVYNTDCLYRYKKINHYHSNENNNIKYLVWRSFFWYWSGVMVFWSGFDRWWVDSDDSGVWLSGGKWWLTVTVVDSHSTPIRK